MDSQARSLAAGLMLVDAADEDLREIANAGLGQQLLLDGPQDGKRREV